MMSLHHRPRRPRDIHPLACATSPTTSTGTRSSRSRNPARPSCCTPAPPRTADAPKSTTSPRSLGAEINDETATGGHYWAVRSFGAIGYEIVAITEHYSAVHDALMSYRGSVTPDLQPGTWT